MKNIHRAAILFDEESLEPVLRDYTACLLKTLGGIFQMEPYHNLTALREGLPDSFRHYLRFQTTGAGKLQDIVIYHMAAGNPGSYIYSYISRYPGAVIYFGDYTTAVKSAGDHSAPGLFMAEMKRAYGKEGEEAVKKIGSRSPAGFYYRKYPLYPAALERALGIMTYTEFEQKRLIRRFPEKIVIGIPVPYFGEGKKIYKQVSETGKSGSVIVHLGPVRSDQTLDRIAAVLRELKRKGLPVTLVLPVRDEEEKKRIQVQRYRSLRDLLIPVSLREEKTLEFFNQRCQYFLKMEEARTLREWLQILEALGSGKTVLMVDLPEFSDLPEDVCIKVRPGRDREKELLSLISILDGDEALRGEVAARADKFLQKAHHPEQVRKAMHNLFADLLKEKRRTTRRGQTDVRKLQAETIRTIVEEAIISLDLENRPYLQKELAGMLKWGS